MPDFLTEDELRRMVIAVTNGEPVPTPSSPYAQQALERIRREVAEIRARPGAIVDLSSDLP